MALGPGTGVGMKGPSPGMGEWAWPWMIVLTSLGPWYSHLMGPESRDRSQGKHPADS